MHHDRIKMLQLTHAGAVVVRKPLLPIRKLLFDNDETNLLKQGSNEAVFLDTILRDEIVRHAIWVSSATLDSKIGDVTTTGQIISSDIKKTVAKYVARMSSRCTPFGLMATTSVVPIGRAKSLAVDENITVNADVDGRLIKSLQENIIEHCRINKEEEIRVYANSTYYQFSDSIRFYELQKISGDNFRSSIGEVQRTAIIDFILIYTRDLVSVKNIAAAVSQEFAAPKTRAIGLIYDLLESGILLYEAELVLTASTNTRRLLGICNRMGLDHEPIPQYVQQLANVTDALNLGENLSCFTELKILSERSRMQDQFKVSNTVRVNAFRATTPQDSGLPSRVVEAIGSNIADILEATCERDSRYDALVKAFENRFGEAEVDLMRALDPDLGIDKIGNNVVGSSLITDLEFFDGASSLSAARFTAYDKVVLRKMLQAVDGIEEITLNSGDLALIKDGNNHRSWPEGCPKTLAVSGFLNEKSNSFYFNGMWTTSALSVLGRFGDGSVELSSLCQRLSEYEMSSHSPSLTADVIFTPSGNISNIVHRKMFMQYEIELNSGRSGFTGSQKIPVNELTIYVQNGRFVLWSRKLGREIVPRMTNAHNTESPDSPVYRFLGMLQRGGWSYSFVRLSGAVFNGFNAIPRIRYGSLILSPRLWVIDANTVEELKRLGSGARALALRQELRDRGCNERVVRYGQFDVTSQCDLTSDIQCDALIDGLKRGKNERIMEATPDCQAFANGTPYGDAFVNELVIPYIVKRKDKYAQMVRSASQARYDIEDIVAAPFDEWLFYKIYVGETCSNVLLAERLHPLVTELKASGLVRRWFFIRYHDSGGSHIRLRLWCGARDAAFQANERCVTILTEATSACMANSFCIVPYERELRRYGGKAGLEICEELFEANSEFVVAAIRNITPASDENVGWLWHLYWVYSMFEDSGLSTRKVTLLAREYCAALRSELSQGDAFNKTLTEMTRGSFDKMKVQFKNTRVNLMSMDPIGDLLAHRLRLVRRLLDVLGATEYLRVMSSLIHMDTNRFFIASQRVHELVMYSVLNKYAAFLSSCD